MKKIIISLNFNGYLPISRNLSFSEKIAVFANYLNNKYKNLSAVAIICLQEFIGGKNEEYINELQKAFPLFEVVKPQGFNVLEHPRSLISINLIRKEYRHESIRLDSCLPNRICYSKVWMGDTPVCILNMYAVQTCIFSPGAASSFIAERKKLKTELWDTVLSEAERRSDPLILVGDMQEATRTGVHIKKLKDLGFMEKNDWFPTIRNYSFDEWNIDHIFYNEAAWKAYYPSETDYDGNVMDELTDHVLIAAISS